VLSYTAANASFASAACSSRPSADVAHACPTEWVRSSVGGCGPRVWLCAADGGAASGACAATDWSRRADASAKGGAPFALAPDGAVVGGWPEPGDNDSPPAEAWKPDLPAYLRDPMWSPVVNVATCPVGWQRDADGCAPALRSDCPMYSEALPDDTCPAEEYADPGSVPSGDRVLHVREGADETTADGSVSNPFPTLFSALSSGRGAAWLRLAGGTYDGPPQIERTVPVIGRCATRVRVRANGGVAVWTVAAGGALVLRGVSTGGGTLGLAVAAGGAETEPRRRTASCAPSTR